jgi:hypothetical protein
MLDRSRPFGTVTGRASNGARYEQDGKQFNGDEQEIDGKGNVIEPALPAPKAKVADPPPVVVKKETPKKPYRVQVHEMAKRLGVPHQDLIEFLRLKGFKVGNHMTMLDEDAIEAATERFATTASDAWIEPAPLVDKVTAEEPQKPRTIIIGGGQ